MLPERSRVRKGRQRQDKESAASAKKAAARSVSSFFTWYCGEYPKLLIQSGKDASQVMKAYRETEWTSHLRGSLSSASQRGASAFLMFYGNHYVSNSLGQPTDIAVVNAGMSGFISGGLSSFVHTVFEPLKIRLERQAFSKSWQYSMNIYYRSLIPMFWRHALFDAAFFATNAAVKDQPYSIQFGISAFIASCVNLTHDVWKTKFIKALPRRISYLMVIQNMTFREYGKQLFFKSIDLGTNWFLTGLVLSSMYPRE